MYSISITKEELTTSTKWLAKQHCQLESSRLQQRQQTKLTKQQKSLNLWQNKQKWFERGSKLGFPPMFWKFLEIRFVRILIRRCWQPSRQSRWRELRSKGWAGWSPSNLKSNWTLTTVFKIQNILICLTSL